MNQQFKVGDRVFWTDPDGGIASGYGHIVEIKADGGISDDDTIIVVELTNGGEAEVLRHEIGRASSHE